MSKLERGKLKDVESNVEDVLNSKEKAFVLFYASWCPFSQRFLPIFDKQFVKHPQACLRIRIDDKQKLMDKYSVDVVPTVLVFEKGKVTRRCDGEAGVGRCKHVNKRGSEIR